MQENLEEQKLFSTHVEALEKKMQSTMLKMEAGFSDTAYVQVGQNTSYFSQISFPTQT